MSAAATNNSMLGIRQRILQTTLWATAALVSIAYIPSVILAYQLQIWSLLVIDNVAWVAVFVLASAKQAPYHLRAGLFLGLWAAIGVFLLWLLGPVGAGTEWLLTVPVLSALFFGFRGAFIGIALTLLILLSYGALLVLAQAPDPAYGDLGYTLESWFGVSGTLLFLCALGSLTAARLLANLEATINELESSRQRIAESLKEREQLQEQLLHSQKLSALGIMASGIAHDFNNLLLPMLMASEEARELAPVGSTQRQHIDNTIVSAERAAHLVKRILSFSQHNNTDASSTPVAPALCETAALLRSTMPANIAITTTINASDACILASADMLHQITMNLGTNACLAMKPRGGELAFKLDLSDSGEHVVLTVNDTGPGVPEDIQHRIFEPFFTTRDAGEGTGLGLAIVHKLVTELGGSIRVDSRPDVGTVFTLTFRTTPAAAAISGAVSSYTTTPETTQSPAAYRVMVVDDEELVLATIRMTLQREGFYVIEHASAAPALRHLQDTSKTTIDLLISDQTMPGMTGIELATQVRATLPQLPILLASGNLSETERKQIQLLGNVVPLDKPFSRNMLLSAVDAIRSVRTPL